MRKRVLFVAMSLVVLVGRASADVVRIEPDDYPDYGDMTNPYPGVTLWVLGSDRQRIESFKVRARVENSGYTSTGTKVFAHEGVAFFNNIRQLRVNFAGGASSIGVDFIGGTALGTDVGRLEAYNSAGMLLAEDVSLPLAPNVIETLSIDRPTADIAYAIVYSRPGEGNFGVVDNLVVNVVPEPGVAGLVLGGMMLCLRRTRRA